MHVVMSVGWRRHGRLVSVSFSDANSWKFFEQVVIDVVAEVDVVVIRNNNNNSNSNNKFMNSNNGFENMIIDDIDITIDPSFINIVVIVY